MLVRLTLVLMMALLCSKPEHELPHQPQFLPSPRNLSITGLLRWALFYFAAPYCPTSMARCLIFFLVLNGGGAIKNTSYLYVIAEGEEASLPCRVKNLFQHYTVREVCTLCYAALDSLFGRPMQWWYWMSKNATPNSWNEIFNPLWKYAQVSWIRASDVTVLSVGHLTFSSGQQPTSYKLLLMYHC